MSNELSLIIRDNEIIYNGIRFIPDYTVIPNKIKIFLFKENNTAIRILGGNPKGIIVAIKKAMLSDRDANHGVIFLLKDDKEITRYKIYTNKLNFIEDLLYQTNILSILSTNEEM